MYYKSVRTFIFIGIMTAKEAARNLTENVVNFSLKHARRVVWITITLLLTLVMMYVIAGISVKVGR